MGCLSDTRLRQIVSSSTLNVRIICSCLVLLHAVIVRADWPAFRGPQGDGHAPVSESRGSIPMRWSETENIAWKTPIPHRGWSTPIIVEGKVWLTTATKDGRQSFVICLDADSGRILLNRRLFDTENPEPLGNDMNGYASPSPVAESGRVYVHFGSYGTACLDTMTYEVLWQRRDLPCRHYRGPGSSPILYQDYLVLTMDGVDVQYLIALDKETGRTVWKTERTTDWDDLGPDGKPFMEGDMRKAYTTPLVVKTDDGPQMISVGAKAAYGYNPANGRELWKVRYAGYSNAASPVFGDGLVYIITGFGRTELLAVRIDGTGDVTDTHIAWQSRRLVPRTPSPLLVDGLLFTLSDTGSLICRDAATGEDIWTERLRGNFAASLLYADGRMYCFSREGRATVLRAGRTAEILATNTLESGFMASPAVSDGALFLRSKKHLYRIESAK